MARFQGTDRSRLFDLGFDGFGFAGAGFEVHQALVLHPVDEFTRFPR
jgi:hypothetical protein